MWVRQRGEAKTAVLRAADVLLFCCGNVSRSDCMFVDSLRARGDVEDESTEHTWDPFTCRVSNIVESSAE